MYFLLLHNKYTKLLKTQRTVWFVFEFPIRKTLKHWAYHGGKARRSFTCGQALRPISEIRAKSRYEHRPVCCNILSTSPCDLSNTNSREMTLWKRNMWIDSDVSLECLRGGDSVVLLKKLFSILFDMHICCNSNNNSLLYVFVAFYNCFFFLVLKYRIFLLLLRINFMFNDMIIYYK